MTTIGSVPFWDQYYGYSTPQVWATDGTYIYDSSGTAVAFANSAPSGPGIPVTGSGSTAAPATTTTTTTGMSVWLIIALAAGAFLMLRKGSSQ